MSDEGERRLERVGHGDPEAAERVARERCRRGEHAELERAVTDVGDALRVWQEGLPCLNCGAVLLYDMLTGDPIGPAVLGECRGEWTEGGNVITTRMGGIGEIQRWPRK